MDRRRLRDMARRRIDMRERARDMRERRMDRRYDMGYTGEYVDTEYTRRYGNSNYPQSDYERRNMGSQYDREYPYYMNDYNYDYARSRRTGRYTRDRMDYGSGGYYLSDEELKEWQMDLMKEIDPQFKGQFERNRVIQRGKEMGVDFKDFTEEEYLTTVLMIATDFGKTVGMNNTDQMFRMAYDWLIDPDAEITGSEKLAVYYDEIVCAE